MERPFDHILKAHAPFKRYTSLTQAGIDTEVLAIPANKRDEINRLTQMYKDKFVRLLSPSFRVPDWNRSTSGPMVNLDEAMDGVPECFRRKSHIKKAPLRIGINVSRMSAANEVVAIRGAAVLALMELCKRRGQLVQVEIAYGNGVVEAGHIKCHARIEIHNPNVELMTRINCSEDTLGEFGRKVVSPLAGEAYGCEKNEDVDLIKLQGPYKSAWMGFYRFAEFPWEKKGQHEYDFVLDRIDSTDAETEERRVMKQLKKFGMLEGGKV